MNKDVEDAEKSSEKPIERDTTVNLSDEDADLLISDVCGETLGRYLSTTELSRIGEVQEPDETVEDIATKKDAKQDADVTLDKVEEDRESVVCPKIEEILPKCLGWGYLVSNFCKIKKLIILDLNGLFVKQDVSKRDPKTRQLEHPPRPAFDRVNIKRVNKELWIYYRRDVEQFVWDLRQIADAMIWSNCTAANIELILRTCWPDIWEHRTYYFRYLFSDWQCEKWSYFEEIAKAPRDLADAINILNTYVELCLLVENAKQYMLEEWESFEGCLQKEIIVYDGKEFVCLINFSADPVTKGKITRRFRKLKDTYLHRFPLNICMKHQKGDCNLIPKPIAFLFYLGLLIDTQQKEPQNISEAEPPFSLQSVSTIENLDKAEELKEEPIDLALEKKESANLDVALFRAQKVVNEPIEDVPISKMSLALVHLSSFHLNGKDYITLCSIQSLFNIREDYCLAAISEASQVAKDFVDIEGESKEEFLALDLETSNQKFLEALDAFDLCLKRVAEVRDDIVSVTTLTCEEQETRQVSFVDELQYAQETEHLAVQDVSVNSAETEVEQACSSETQQPYVKISKDDRPKSKEEANDMQSVPYASACGSLMYAMVATRLDIAHAVRVVSRFMATPSRLHWDAVNSIMRYLKGTKNKCLCYGKGPLELKGFCDSDMASDVDTRNPQAVMCLLLQVVLFHGVLSRLQKLHS
ncbi:hypothetical protein L7F22_032552 [Adiantum nelumboides]|nr:hypothetical protein [Adiantum nelumboides]